MNYFMLNAAVALEAYLGDYRGYAENKGVEPYSSDNKMVHPDWYDYHKRLGASEWHQIFKNNSDDPRLRLSWRERFADISQKGVEIYDFYSEGEDVLATHEGSPVLFKGLMDALLDNGRHAWVYQEKWKGRAPYDGYGGTTIMGWGFNSDDYEERDTVAANALSMDKIKTVPFFHKPEKGSLGGDIFEDVVTQEYINLYRDELLAKAFPALTLPTGGPKGGGDG